jgi:hypothetical protein
MYLSNRNAEELIYSLTLHLDALAIGIPNSSYVVAMLESMVEIEYLPWQRRDSNGLQATKP